MNYAIIENNIVTNVIVADAAFAASIGAVPAQNAGIGWTYAGGVFTAPEPQQPATPTVAEYTAAIQAMLDAEARTHNYDGILSLASYASSTNPQFAAEGQAGLEWRDAVWGASYALMAQVHAGEITQPTIAELLAMLPVMVWPA